MFSLERKLSNIVEKFPKMIHVNTMEFTYKQTKQQMYVHDLITLPTQEISRKSVDSKKIYY